MSDLRTTDPSSASEAESSYAPVSPGAFEIRDGLRVDPPHQFGSTLDPHALDPHALDSVGSGTLPPRPNPFPNHRPNSSSGAEHDVEYDVVHEPISESMAAAAHQTQFPYGDPLLQARQIAEHLQKRYSELQRREARLAAQLSQLDQERRTVRMWVSECEAVLQQRDVELAERETQSEDRETACLKLEHELQARKAELLVREKEMQEIQARWRAEWETERAQLQQEIDQKRIELRNDQATFQQIKETQLAEIQQERTLLLSRIRFQEEHLKKLRGDFETTQNAFLADKQKWQTTFLETEQQQHRRQIQLERYRSLLEERDAGIQRQHMLLAKTRKAGVDSLTQDHQRMVADQRDWQIVRDRQHADIVRQTEMLRLNAENLEARQQRLEKLRLELEETNRRTLEMRLVVEDACAQLAQAVGPTAARQRIEASQSALTGLFLKAREQVDLQRQELEQFQKTLGKQREELRSEQQTLTDWMTKRDEELKAREASLRQEQAVATTREQAWQNMRERWLLEKLEAEAIIRDLMKRLEAQ